MHAVSMQHAAGHILFFLSSISNIKAGATTLKRSSDFLESSLVIMGGGVSKEWSSSLTIVNNTPFEFFCMVGPDTAALEIFSYVSIALGAIASIALSGGIAAPVALTSVSSSVAAITGLSVQVVRAVVVATTVIGSQQTVVRVLDKVVMDQVETLKREGFTKIPSGGRHQFGGHTISRWLQGNCKRVRSFEDRSNGQMYTLNDEVFMRPILSGPIIGSNKDHDIQFWINKFGFENELKLIVQPPNGRSSWGNLDALMDEFEALFDTKAPTDSPSDSPTPAPTRSDTKAPTDSPSASPTSGPTSAPVTPSPSKATETAAPTGVPSSTAPTMPFTIAPTAVPSTIIPTAVPSTITPSTMMPVTIAPTAPYKCDVCMYSYTGSITNPDAIVTLPNHGNFTCAEIEKAGKDGLIDEINCPLVIQFLRPCGCYLPYQQCWDPLGVVPEEPSSSKSGKSSSMKMKG